MVAGVAIAFESLFDVVDLFESTGGKYLACGQRTSAAAADQQDRRIVRRGPATVEQRLFNLRDEAGIGLPVGRVLPGDVNGADRMADVIELHAAAHADEHCRGLMREDLHRPFRVDPSHRGSRHLRPHVAVV